jgi:putative transposase
MGLTYTAKNQSRIYYITFTVHQWVDVFTRKEYVDIFLESVRFCQKEKRTEGLRLGSIIYI